MTRRARSKPHFLTPDQYIARATAGLTGAEKVDAAAELRAHLLERVAEHEAQGFSRVEAEYLAVQSMGEPPLAQTKPWGAWLTRAGWGVLALMLLGGGGWYVYREWMPPKEGVKLEAASPADINYLFSLPDAPRGTYQAATLTFPKETEAMVYANVKLFPGGYSDLRISANDVKEVSAYNIRGRIPSSYRYQERWLWMSERLTCDGLPYARHYVKGQTLASPFWNSGRQYRLGLLEIENPCSNPKVKLRVVKPFATAQKTRIVAPDGEGAVFSGEGALTLNQWTVLSSLVIDPQNDPSVSYSPPKFGQYSQKAEAVMIAVLPLNRAQLAAQPKGNAPRVNFGGHNYPLPPFPSVSADPQP